MNLSGQRQNLYITAMHPSSVINNCLHVYDEAVPINNCLHVYDEAVPIPTAITITKLTQYCHESPLRAYLHK